ncbi:MAG: hypothetical protein IJ008_01140 [Clostridia bacterium]|nr:hypothetical protein [Clostridia bacterium]
MADNENKKEEKVVENQQEEKVEVVEEKETIETPETSEEEKVEEKETVSEEVSEEAQEDNNTNKKSLKKKEKNQEVKKPQTHDEIYESVENQRLFNRKRKKTIISITALSLVFIFAITVILMATIKVNLMPKCLADAEIYSIKVCTNGETPAQSKTIITEADDTNEQYEIFLENYENMFKISFLNAWFSGQFSDYEIIEHIEDAFTKNSVESEYASKNANYFYITFINENKLTTKDGEEVISKYNSSYAISFKAMYMEASKENKAVETSIYLVVDYPTSGSTNSKLTRIVEVKLKANTNALYESWNDLI